MGDSYLRYRDSHHPEWVSRAYRLAPPAFAALLAEEAEWLRREVGRGPIVEIGCGAGRLLAVLERLGAPLVGLDLVLRYLPAAARSARRALLVSADAFRPPLRPAAFAAVVLAQATLGSLGGETARRRLVLSLAPLSAPGGVLLLSVYGERCRTAREEWYRAQQAEGLLPPFDGARTRDGVFAFTNGFVSEEVSLAELAALRPPGFGGAVRELASGLRVAQWLRADEPAPHGP